MAPNPSTPASFSAGRRWLTILSVFVSVLAVIALVGMVNYLGGRYFTRFSLSTQTKPELSSLTVGLLKSLTNDVTVVIYYDKDEPLFSSVSSLLEEYKLASKHIKLQVVDYLRDSGTAQTVKAKYNLGTFEDKNLVIFESNGTAKVIDGGALAEYEMEQVPNPNQPEFRKKIKSFKGEMEFTSALVSVTNPRPLLACYLEGHGEHPIDSSDAQMGYLNFATVLQHNNIQVARLSLAGTNQIPECNLLIIAGPIAPIPTSELEKIQQYLNQGGRLLVLFHNFTTSKRVTGLEKILADWNVGVGSDIISDPEHSDSKYDLLITKFGNHPMVNPLLGSRLQVLLPRSIFFLKTGRQAEAPKVDEIAFTSPTSISDANSAKTGEKPIMVAVEKGNIKGVVTDRGTTRIVVVGDSMFLGNQMIHQASNHDFAGYAVNWLLDRTQLLQGLGPRPVAEYKLSMTNSQLKSVQWILLAGMPGAILLFGGLVWLRRRH